MAGNFNAGKVVVNCKINSYCPFERTPYVDHTIVLNSETIKSMPDSDNAQFSWVSGEQGIFLKEQLHNYHSQSLYVDGKPLCPEYFELYTNTGNGQSISEAETEHFSWKTTNSAFYTSSYVIDAPSAAELISAPISQIPTTASQSTHSNDNVKWRCQSEPVTLSSDNGERSDSRVVMPVACVANPTKERGSHWRVVKKTDLFRGEDFFVEFRRTTTAIDTSNIKSKPFANYGLEGGNSDIYKTLDSRFSEDTEGLPINTGVVQYKIEIDDKNIATFSAVEDSRQAYDLNNQAYFIIEMGVGLQYRYVILVTQKGYPRFIKIINDNATYRSLVVGEYKEITGSALMNLEVFRVSVRNHLGKIVVVFNDLKPWIVADVPTQAQSSGASGQNNKSSAIQTKDDAILQDMVQERSKQDSPSALFVVPSAPIAIWGGNISMGFLFSPITYNFISTTILPVADKNTMITEGASFNQSPFVLPIPANINILFGQRQPTMSSSSTTIPTTNGTSSLSSIPTSDSGGLIRSKKKYFYTCDCHLATEIINMKQVVNINPYFMDYGDYIKEEDLGTSTKNELSGGSRCEVEIIKSKNQPEDEGSIVFSVKLSLQSGSHKFSNGWFLKNCKTPIADIIRLESVPINNTAWPTKEIDASDLIMSYNESWSSSDFSKMEHTGTIRFLVNKGQKNDDLRKSVEALRNKAFYIKVEAGYDGCNYPRLDGLKRMITGISYGGVISEKAGERTMECKIYDYTKVLEQALIFNSPFFDGVRDINAIYELSKFVRFKEDTIKISVDTINGKLQTDVDADPSFLLARSVQSTKDKDEYGGGDGLQSPDGRKVTKTKVYALPHGYNILQGGAEFKFNDGDMVASAMDKICKRSGKVLFFDSYGMLHYESFPIASVLYNPSTDVGQAGEIVPSQWNFSVSPLVATNGTMLLHTQLTRESAVEDVYNNIFVVTSTPKQELIFADDINKKSVDDPTAEGFLGYRKTFFQMDGIFGSVEAVTNYMKHLKKFYRPPVVYKFETFGVPMRCFDIVNVDGQKMIVVNVSQNIDAKDNKWWMNVEGEWYFGDTGSSLT